MSQAKCRKINRRRLPIWNNRSHFSGESQRVKRNFQLQIFTVLSEFYLDILGVNLVKLMAIVINRIKHFFALAFYIPISS